MPVNREVLVKLKNIESPISISLVKSNITPPARDSVERGVQKDHDIYPSIHRFVIFIHHLIFLNKTCQLHITDVHFVCFSSKFVISITDFVFWKQWNLVDIKLKELMILLIRNIKSTCTCTSIWVIQNKSCWQLIWTDTYQFNTICSTKAQVNHLYKIKNYYQPFHRFFKGNEIDI